MECPACKSEDVAKLQMIHADGIVTTDGTSRSWKGTVTKKDVSTTGISALAAPPAPPRGSGTAVGLFIGVIVAIWGSIWAGLIIAGVVLAICAWEGRKYKAAMSAWQAAWMCRRCGSRFTP